MTARHILVVDDEPDIRILLKEILDDEGFDVSVAENAAQAREARRQRRPDLILLDIWMPDTDGISLLKEWSADNHLDVPVIMMSGHGNVETAVEATRLGAYDFIEKPLSIAKLLITVQRGLENANLQRENIGLRRSAPPLAEPIGRSRTMEQLRSSVLRIAQHKTAVFITGESGSGKEVVARFLHQHSPRAGNPFVAVGVAGLARENPDAELFGTESDGHVTYGSLEQANGGTLFLKDIADMDLSTQARLLSALEQQAMLRVGGREPVPIDVRIMAATRRDLQSEVNAGRFRDDLLCESGAPVPRDRLQLLRRGRRKEARGPLRSNDHDLRARRQDRGRRPHAGSRWGRLQLAPSWTRSAPRRPGARDHTADERPRPGPADGIDQRRSAQVRRGRVQHCLLYTSDAADE